MTQSCDCAPALPVHYHLCDVFVASCAKLNQKVSFHKLRRHLFCGQCLRESIKKLKNCPTCRKGFRVNQIHRVYLS